MWHTVAQMKSKKHTTDEGATVRARVDTTLNAQWEEWCARANITPSQALRWLLQMHLKNPTRLWDFLREQEQHANESSAGEHHD